MKPDEFAQQIELKEWEARQASGRLSTPVVESATHCKDPHCGEEIPEARRKARPGVQFCAECQARREMRAKIR